MIIKLFSISLKNDNKFTPYDLFSYLYLQSQWMIIYENIFRLITPSTPTVAPPNPQS
jgi:hypothetical protein